MSHFKLIRTSEIFESPAHEDNGVAIGDTQVFLCSATASRALTKARPRGTAFTADASRNVKWFKKFMHHADHNSPEFVRFARGVSKYDRWYAEAVAF